MDISRGTTTVLMAALLATAAATAQAAPFTVHFTGTVTDYYDYVTWDTTPPETSFSGYVTYDVASPEGSTDDGATYVEASSESGCQADSFGVCKASDQYGTDAPIVADYAFTFGAVTFRPLTSTGTFPVYDYSNRVNQQYESLEYWQAYRIQDQFVYSGDPDGLYGYAFAQRTLMLTPHNEDLLAMLHGAYDDFYQAFDLTAVPAGQWNVHMVNVAETSSGCTTGNGCTSSVYAPGSFYLNGTLTSATFAAGTASIPEPGILASLGLGALAFGLSMRPRRTGSSRSAAPSLPFGPGRRTVSRAAGR